MNPTLILFAQTIGGATLEILSLLIVAAIIGYVTAWLFYRSVYEKKLKVVKSEKHELNNRIVNLNGDVVEFQKNLDDKDQEIERFFAEYFTQYKQVLDYNSFGKARIEDKDDLTMISGIGPFIEKGLNSLEIYTFRQISRFSNHDIKVINNTIIYFSGRIDRDEWVAQARELAKKQKIKVAV